MATFWNGKSWINWLAIKSCGTLFSDNSMQHTLFGVWSVRCDHQEKLWVTVGYVWLRYDHPTASVSLDARKCWTQSPGPCRGRSAVEVPAIWKPWRTSCATNSLGTWALSRPQMTSKEYDYKYYNIYIYNIWWYFWRCRTCQSRFWVHLEIGIWYLFLA